MNIGRKIYYDIKTGNILADTGEVINGIKTTVDEDIRTYNILSERNRASFDVIELPYGKYTQDFMECNSYRVNPEDKILEFSYPDASADNITIYQKPLSEKLTVLEQENAELKLALTEAVEKQERDKIELQLVIAQMVEASGGTI